MKGRYGRACGTATDRSPYGHPSPDPQSPEHYRRPISGTKGPMNVWSDGPRSGIRTVAPPPRRKIA